MLTLSTKMIRSIFFPSRFLFLKILNFLVKSLRIQLFITLCSLPIFWYWNLPISLINPLSNIFFGPVLLIFLVISSIIFFTELCHIPNGFVIFLLEKITEAWIWCTSNLSTDVLFLFAKPALPYGLVIPVLAIICLQHKQLQNPIKSLFALFLLGFTLIFYSILIPTKFGIFDISQQAILINTNLNQMLVYKRIKQNINYFQVNKELIDSILQHKIRCLSTIIMQEANCTSFEKLIQLIRSISVKEIYLPYPNKDLSITGWNQWILLLELCRKKNIFIKQINTKLTLSISNTLKNDLLTIHLLPKSFYKKNYIEVLGAWNTKTFIEQINS